MSNVVFNVFGYKFMLFIDLKYLYVFFVENLIECW